MRLFLFIFILLLSACSSFQTNEKVLSRINELEKKQKDQTEERAKLLLIMEEKNQFIEKKINTIETYTQSQNLINQQILAQIQTQNKIIQDLNNDYQGTKYLNYKMLLEYANKLYSQRKYQTAANLYDKLINYRKTLSKKDLYLISYRQALTNYRLNKYNSSINQFMKIVAQQSDSRFVPSSLYHMGVMWLRQKKYDQAIDAFKEIIKKHRYNQRFYQNAKRALEITKQRKNSNPNLT